MGKGYTKSGDEHVSGGRQSMYSKDTHYEGNMGHNTSKHGHYEPTHTIHKGHGGIKGAKVEGVHNDHDGDEY